MAHIDAPSEIAGDRYPLEPDADVAEENLAKDLVEAMLGTFDGSGYRRDLILPRDLTVGVIEKALKLLSRSNAYSKGVVMSNEDGKLVMRMVSRERDGLRASNSLVFEE